jgi:hypothetical protein
MPKYFLLHVITHLVLVVLSTWIWADHMEQGDANAITMYLVVAFLPWIVMIGCNVGLLAFVHNWVQARTTKLAWLLGFPCVYFLFLSVTNGWFVITLVWVLETSFLNGITWLMGDRYLIRKNQTQSENGSNT